MQFHDVRLTTLDLLEMRNDTLAMHGRSFRAVLEADAEALRSAVIPGYQPGQKRCVRDPVWRYIRRPEDQPDELFSLEEDPRERHNVSDEHAEEARRLASQFGPYFFRTPVREIKGLQGRYEMGSASVG